MPNYTVQKNCKFSLNGVDVTAFKKGETVNLDTKAGMALGDKVKVLPTPSQETDTEANDESNVLEGTDTDTVTDFADMLNDVE